MAKNEPLTGPFPDGDSRNLTLVKSDNPIELERTGPQEPEYRGEGAPESVMGDLPMNEDTKNSREESSSGRSDNGADSDDVTSHETPQPYDFEAEPAPSAAETAFDRPTGGLQKPVLQKDWNPAERNSDDLSR